MVYSIDGGLDLILNKEKPHSSSSTTGDKGLREVGLKEEIMKLIVLVPSSIVSTINNGIMEAKN